VRYFLQLVQTKDTDRHSAIILKGYIYHHEDQCSNPECTLKTYKIRMRESRIQKGGGAGGN